MATDPDLESLAHVFLTTNSPWNPNIVDCSSIFPWFKINVRPMILTSICFGSIHAPSCDPGESHITQEHLDAAVEEPAIMSQTMKRCLPDLDALSPNFGWVSKEWIHNTLERTLQHYIADQHVPMRKHFCSHFPATIVHHLNEWYSTNTFISDVSGYMMACPGMVAAR